jgi:hypothetical protein
MWPELEIEKPKSLNILGVNIPVTYHTELISEVNLGEFHSAPLEIKIVDNEDWAYHLIHEAVHAALHLSGYREFMSRKVEEGVARVVELAFRSVVENLES